MERGAAAASDDDQLKGLLNMYEQFQGQVPPGAPPELKGFFESIDKSKQEHARQQQAQAQEGTQEIYPAPEFVVKTSDDTGRKVFINVCSSDAVEAPGNWEGGAVPEAVRANLDNLENLSEADQEHMRFPLSLSEPRNDLDKQGEACTVFDCVFNSDIIRGAQKLRSLKVFIIEMALGWIGHKHHLNLDARFKLPKLRYKGDTIVPQNIRKEKKPMVVEMADVDEPDEEPSLPLRVSPMPKGKAFKPTIEELPSPAAASTASKPHAAPAPVARGAAAHGADAASTSGMELSVQYDERPCRYVTVSLSIPPGLVCGPEDISVRASCDSVHFHLAGIGPRVAQLNVFVKAESGRVSVKDGSIRVRFEYFPADALLEHMRACKPFAVGSLKLATSAMLDDLE